MSGNNKYSQMSHTFAQVGRLNVFILARLRHYSHK